MSNTVAYKVLVAVQGPPHRRQAVAQAFQIIDQRQTRSLNRVVVMGNGTSDAGMLEYALESLSEQIKSMGLEL